MELWLSNSITIPLRSTTDKSAYTLLLLHRGVEGRSEKRSCIPNVIFISSTDPLSQRGEKGGAPSMTSERSIKNPRTCDRHVWGRKRRETLRL